MHGTKRRRFLWRIYVVCLLMLSFGGATPAGAVPPPDYFAAPAFGFKYRETDGGEGYPPYFDNRANLGLPLVWGEQIGSKLEAWAGSPAGFRLVQYFEKGRMELTDPARPDVTAGLLASELLTGRVDVGGGRSVALTPPAIAAAGDESGGLPYSRLTPYRDHRADPESVARGDFATLLLNYDYSETTRPQAANDPQAQFVEYDAATGHAVPRAFAMFRADPRHPLGTVGYAITAPVWKSLLVRNKPHDVLVQVFERRVLTYTPDNPEAYRVELGNVGLQYLRWRYNAFYIPPPYTKPETARPPLETEVSPTLRVAVAAQGNPGLGAPLGPSRTAAFSVLPFNGGGYMLYVAEERRVYVLFPDGHTGVYDDTWREGDDPGGAMHPSVPPATEPSREPAQGFGAVWRNNPEVRALGLTFDGERGFTSETQRFAGGFVVARPPGSGDLLIGTTSGRWSEFQCGNTAFRQGGGEITPYTCPVP